MVASVCRADRSLAGDEVRAVLEAGLGASRFAGKRVLVIIPDGTRTAPIPEMYRCFHEVLGPMVGALDFLVALGTHPPMSEQALGRLVGVPVTAGSTGASMVFNHRWDLEETFVTVGTITAEEIRDASEGRMDLEVPVRLNRLVGDPNGERPYDELIVCGPVFPHEVAGFSGGNKYFVPGVSGQAVIDATHWLGALLTSKEIIGVADTPMRRLIDRAASFIPTPTSLVAMVMHGDDLRGLFVGEMDETWRRATELSAMLDIVWVDRPFRRVLSVVPRMYDDLWTGAKGMYKLEPAVADGGEVVIFAPHITEVSFVHGKHIDEVGYHVRDYFVAQWERFARVPWGILAHSTHLRGAGTYLDGVERARINVTLATGIPEERCRRIGLGYLDPSTVELQEWAGREAEGILLVPRAGERLFRVRPENSSGTKRR
ncbi:MAG TPA: lactate racemase domain-containing protein [Methylomirabilota bacterium]|nr:lactate racemase domain-containing protein [Methylomirabilota bacterium]